MLGILGKLAAASADSDFISFARYVSDDPLLMLSLNARMACVRCHLYEGEISSLTLMVLSPCEYEQDKIVKNKTLGQISLVVLLDKNTSITSWHQTCSVLLNNG